MKKEFNLKLTLFLVSLFIGLLLVIIGNSNKYCLCFGFVAMGISFGFYTLFKTEKYDSEILKLQNQKDENDDEEAMLTDKVIKKLTKQKHKFVAIFSVATVLMVFVGFSFLL